MVFNGGVCNNLIIAHTNADSLRVDSLRFPYSRLGLGYGVSCRLKFANFQSISGGLRLPPFMLNEHATIVIKMSFFPHCKGLGMKQVTPGP